MKELEAAKRALTAYQLDKDNDYLLSEAAQALIEKLEASNVGTTEVVWSQISGDAMVRKIVDERIYGKTVQLFAVEVEP